MATPQDQLEALTRLTAQQVGVLKAIQGVVGQISAGLKGGRSGPGAGLGAAPGAGKAKGAGALEQIQGVVGKIGKGLGAAGAIIGTVVAALTAVPLAIAGVVKASESYVRALNPALVEQYEREQANLSATIGYGLEPVIAYATKSLREWAGILLPSIQQLRPIVERISAVVSGIAPGAVRLLGSVLSGFMAQLSAFLPAIEHLGETVGAVAEVFAVVSDVVGGFAGAFGAFAPAFEGTATVFRKVATAATVLTARLLQLAGASETLARFRAGLEKAIEARKNPASGLLAAPTDAGTRGIEEIMKRLNEKAFIATAGGTTKKNDTEYLEELVGQVREIEKSGPKDWQQLITDAVRAALPENPAAGVVKSMIGARDTSAGGGRSTLGAVVDFLATGEIPMR